MVDDVGCLSTVGKANTSRLCNSTCLPILCMTIEFLFVGILEGSIALIVLLPLGFIVAIVLIYRHWGVVYAALHSFCGAIVRAKESVVRYNVCSLIRIFRERISVWDTVNMRCWSVPVAKLRSKGMAKDMNVGLRCFDNVQLL